MNREKPNQGQIYPVSTAIYQFFFFEFPDSEVGVNQIVSRASNDFPASMCVQLPAGAAQELPRTRFWSRYPTGSKEGRIKRGCRWKNSVTSLQLPVVVQSRLIVIAPVTKKHMRLPSVLRL